MPLGVGIAALLGACGAGSTATTDRSVDALSAATTAAPATTTQPKVECSNPTASYEARSPLPATVDAQRDTFMRELLARQRLTVAVDENTQGLASRDPGTGDLEGLEIDLAQRLAQRIFGGDLGDHIRFRTVTTKQKIEYPQDGKVDLAVSAISMTCDRWRDVAFSSEYLLARHAFLVRKDSKITTPDDVAGRRVCMTRGSTSIAVLDEIDQHLSTQGRASAQPVLVDARNDCLLALQEGTVDAYLGHDTFLVGMIAQDDNLRIVDQGTPQHYGIAVNQDHTYFVQYINGLLAELRADGTLQGLYQRWFHDLNAAAGLPDETIPVPVATRPVP